MNDLMDYQSTRDLLLAKISPLDAEAVPLERADGRVLAFDLRAAADVPSFDRSPYDGYAFRAADTAGASRRRPVTLKILGEIRAGAAPEWTLAARTAVKILTGAPLPSGADAVAKFEDVAFTAETVTLFQSFKSGDNVVVRGEDARRGELLVRRGTAIDAGAAGTLGAQNVLRPLVFRRPRVGLISTGSELQEDEESLRPGMIRNANRYSFAAALRAAGCVPCFAGTARDDAAAIAALVRHGLEECDALVVTGGVSAGDYDLTPEALALAGAETAVRDVRLKPGGKCVYAFARGKMIAALSGNPASALTNFYAVALPCLKKLAGRAAYLPETIDIALAYAFNRKSPQPRLLHGRLSFDGGRIMMDPRPGQGNGVLSGLIGCGCMALVPAGSGALPVGTVLKGFLL